VFETDQARDFFEFSSANTTAIGRANQGSNAGARNVIDRNFFFFQDLQCAYMSDAASESAAERDPDFGALPLSVWLFG
jgi:hypothetical protein